MKKIIIYYILSIICISTADAAIPYRAQQVRAPETESDSESLARHRRFYVGADYNFAMWQNVSAARADNFGIYEIELTGKNTPSFDVVAGIRVYDTFRLEANYFAQHAEWNSMKIDGNTVFMNALFDARIDSLYRIFRKQVLVPYVGFGAGLSWNSADGATIENKISPTLGALAGIGLELGDRFALDFGYRYFYEFSPKSDLLDFAPVSHQFRAGARLHF